MDHVTSTLPTNNSHLVIKPNSKSRHHQKVRFLMLLLNSHLPPRVVLLLTILTKQIRMLTSLHHILWAWSIVISSQFVMAMDRMVERSVVFWSIDFHSTLKIRWRRILGLMILQKSIPQVQRFLNPLKRHSIFLRRKFVRCSKIQDSVDTPS